MTCLAEIDCGSSQARAELLFMVELLIQLGDRIEPRVDFSGSLGFRMSIVVPHAGQTTLSVSTRLR